MFSGPGSAVRIWKIGYTDYGPGVLEGVRAVTVRPDDASFEGNVEKAGYFADAGSDVK